ncbi:hypothetical protein FRB99_001339 [Tulasnella sp. 403]|nr:hypothetical protein FRB99_001339 [Tulasnella sp. 403]
MLAVKAIRKSRNLKRTFVSSVIFSLFLTTSVSAQAVDPVDVLIQTPTNVVACAAVPIYWSLAIDPSANLSAVTTAIQTTSIGVWVTNVGVPQTPAIGVTSSAANTPVVPSSAAPLPTAQPAVTSSPVQTTPAPVAANPSSVFVGTTQAFSIPSLDTDPSDLARVLFLRKRQNIVPITKNITASPRPLSPASSGGLTRGGGAMEKRGTSGPTVVTAEKGGLAGILAAIGIASPTKTGENRRKSSRVDASESYLANQATNSPETTVEGRASSHQKGSGGSSAELGQLPTLPMPITGSRPESYGQTSRKSSSVTTFAQSINGGYNPFASTADSTRDGASGVARRASTRSSRSAMQRSDKGEDYAMAAISPSSAGDTAIAHTSESWTGRSLPGGAAPPTVIAGGVNAASRTLPSPSPPFAGHMSQPDVPYTPTGPSPSPIFAANLNSPTSPTPTPNRSTPKTVSRKKAPELPFDLDPTRSPTPGGTTISTARTMPSSYHYATQPGPTYSTSSLNQTSYTSHERMPNPPVRRASADVVGGRQSNDALGLNDNRTMSPGSVSGSPEDEAVLNSFAGAKEGPVHLLMPDMPPEYKARRI